MKSKALLFIILFSLCVYGISIRGALFKGVIPKELASTGGAFESSHERAPYETMVSLVENKSVNLSPDQAKFAAPDVGYIAGKFYSLFPPGVSLLIIPMYLLGNLFGAGQIFAFATMILFAVGILFLIFKIATKIFKLSDWGGLISALTYAFATTSWGYSTTIYQHIPTTFLMLFLFYFTYKYGQDTKKYFWWATICLLLYGFGIFIDYPNGVLFLPILIYLLLQGTKLLNDDGRKIFIIKPSLYISSIAGIIVLISLITYNSHTFGSWKILHNRLPRYTAQGVEGGVSNSNAIAEQKSDVTSVFSLKNIPYSFETFTFGLDRGLFVFSPVLLLGLIGLCLRKNHKLREYSVLLSIMVVNFLLYGTTGDPWGGWAYGARYLIPTMAILSIFVGVFVNDSKWKRFIFFPLFIFSLFISFLGVITSNLVPPKGEAIGLGLHSNIMLNLGLLKNGTTGNFIYNNWLRSILSLKLYYIIVCTILIIIFIFISESIYRKEKYYSKEKNV